MKVPRKRESEEYQTLAKETYHSVQSRSQETFLWANLTFDQIRDSPSPEAIRKILQSVPKGLDDMLYHVFRRLGIHEQMDQSYLRDLISWVLCAHRSLYVSELFMLILITASHHYYMIEDHLKARYSSLFHVTGPVASFEQNEEEARKFADDGAFERDGFKFLGEEEQEGSDDETEEVWSLEEETGLTASGVISASNYSRRS